MYYLIISSDLYYRKWWDEAQKQITAPLEPKIKTKLRKLEVPEGVYHNIY